jgi:hypothetical protein
MSVLRRHAMGQNNCCNADNAGLDSALPNEILALTGRLPAIIGLSGFMNDWQN